MGTVNSADGEEFFLRKFSRVAVLRLLHACLVLWQTDLGMFYVLHGSNFQIKWPVLN